ncbi:MAG: 5-formyltetrahydrofolate cyclo-ligase [Pseudomonadota bacterium]|nr:5-formyltetrahydrofolate cyclo-ligase [Pseudomonadota bacterium]
MEFDALELPDNSTPPKQQLRKMLRARRRNLSRQQQKTASMALCRQLSQLPEFIFGRRIAAYIPNDGEIDPQPLLELAWRLGKSVYLPILHPFAAGRLLFMTHNPEQVLAKNRYGIPEPLCRQTHYCPIWTLDLVLTPLVGFDEAGNRMGMGGGFYDRTFAFLNHHGKPRNPTLVGVAHECQKVEALPSERWDIAMRKIVTERAVYQSR